MADVGDPPPPFCPLCSHPTTTAAAASSEPSSLTVARPPLKRKSPPEAPPAVVRVEIGDEAAALREALARQQVAMGELQAELDAERGAAAGAASEAMTMILRLQREKAEAMMEARQFRRYAEEKMSHDASELASLEEVLAKRDAALRALQSRFGVAAAASNASTPHVCSSPHTSSTPHVCSSPRNPSTPPPNAAAASGYYPALRCCIDHPSTASEADTIDVQTPRDHLTRHAHRVHHHLLEHPTAAAAAATTTTPIIRVAPGSAFPCHAHAYSDADSLDFYDGEFFPDDECGASDRVYTIDAIHRRGAPLNVPEVSYCGGTPVGSDCCGTVAPWAEGEEMCRLSARLQALEADRETMRQAIISMGAEKAQIVVLKEIAQQLYRETPPPLPTAGTVAQHHYRCGAAPPAMTVTMQSPQPPLVMHRMVIDRPPRRTFFFASVVKWIASIIWWRRKARPIKYPIGQCGNNAGLLLLLDKASKAGHGHQRFPKKIL